MNKKTTGKSHLRPLAESDFDDLDRWFGLRTEFSKPRERWEEYLRETKKKQRLVVVAVENGGVVGYVTLNYRPLYGPFKKAKIPEIQDLNVARPYRNRGIARALILKIEKIVRASGKKIIGIGVGMEPGYGAAQRLYVKMGYIPDGQGLTYNHTPVMFGEFYPADDELVLYFTKEL